MFCDESEDAEFLELLKNSRSTMIDLMQLGAQHGYTKDKYNKADYVALCTDLLSHADKTANNHKSS